MNNKIGVFKLYLYKNYVQQVNFEAVMDDINTQELQIQLMDKTSPYPLTDVTKIMFTMKQGDKEISSVNVSIVDSLEGVIKHVLESSELSYIGEVTCSVSVFKGTNRVSFQPFTFTVREGMAEPVSPSNNNIPVLNQMIGNMSVLETTVNTSENERNDNESKRITSENTRNNSENTRISSESTRTNNENNRISSESTRIDNENSRTTNESTRQNNENTRIDNDISRESHDSCFLTNEKHRNDYENVRIDNEKERQSHEFTRTDNENARITSEKERRENEDTRKTEYATIKNGIANFNDIYVTDENNRQNTFTNNENNRANNFSVSENNRKSTFDISQQNMATNFNTNETNRANTFTANEAARTKSESDKSVVRVTEFNTIKTDYNTYKNVMIAASPAAELQNNINKNTAQLADNATKTWSSVEKPTCAVTFTDDDGNSTFYTLIRPLCLSKNCKYTSLYVTGSPNMTDEQLNQLQADGLFEFISHSHTHIPPDERTEADLRSDFEASVAWLKARGMNYHGYGAPGGNTNATSRRIIKEYFDYNLSGFSGYSYQPIYQYDIPRVTLFLNGTETLETYKPYVDKALATGAWLVFIGHSWEANFNTTVLGQLIDYIQALNIDIISTQEGIDRFGNLIDVGDHSMQNKELHDCFAVGKNGATNNSFIMQNDTTKTFNSLITDFPRDKMTCLTITDGSLFPDAQGGNLWTYRISELMKTGDTNDIDSFQLWIPYFSGRIYKRSWDSVGKVWKGFAPISGSVVTTANAYTMASTPTNIATKDGSNTVVVTPIYTSNPDIANFPESATGYLTTYNIMVAGSYAQVCQEYRVSLSNNVYKRFWNTGGSVWTAWKRISGNLSLSTTSRNAMITVGMTAGDIIFDTSLNKPVWRNAANNGWVDAAGTTIV